MMNKCQKHNQFWNKIPLDNSNKQTVVFCSHWGDDQCQVVVDKPSNELDEKGE